MSLPLCPASCGCAYTDRPTRFYKEEIAGDRDNYIHGKAAYDGDCDISLALEETANEAIACARRIEAVLEDKGDYGKAWRLHATGYIRMHIMRGRYRLWEVGVGNKPEAKEALSR